MSTVIGSSQAGYVNGVGSAAKVSYPYGIFADSTSNVWIADSGNNMIRKYSTTGRYVIFFLTQQPK